MIKNLILVSVVSMFALKAHSGDLTIKYQNIELTAKIDNVQLVNRGEPSVQVAAKLLTGEYIICSVGEDLVKTTLGVSLNDLNIFLTEEDGSITCNYNIPYGTKKIDQAATQFSIKPSSH